MYQPLACLIIHFIPIIQTCDYPINYHNEICTIDPLILGGAVPVLSRYATVVIGLIYHTTLTAPPSMGFPKINRWVTIWHHRFFSPPFSGRRQLNCRYHVPGYDVPTNLPARERTMESESAPLLNITALEILGEVWRSVVA